ncbi:toxin-antitoxin system YwqK family antitoxin [Flavobacterium sp.]|jgi:antitoxin component YwqK of YwqJK toxin-antitoxin module|uniref:toxin-antitoxin system YwqK family antitoxin n=1 Tax=Flavobacterium sp. TaxID=239 RepID=UPI0037BF0E82
MGLYEFFKRKVGQYEPETSNNELQQILRYHENGNLKIQATVDVDGKIHGNCKEWFLNGIISIDQSFNHGTPHGTNKNYFENGNLFIESNFNNGVRDGKFCEYYENGMLNIITNFKDGKEHGLREQYFPNGNLELRANFIEDKLEGVKILLDENGEVIDESIMHEGFNITQELIVLMTGHHMEKAGIITDEAQEFKLGELSQKIYDYYKINNFEIKNISLMKEVIDLFNKEGIDFNKEGIDLFNKEGIDLYKFGIDLYNKLEVFTLDYPEGKPFTFKLTSNARLATSEEIKITFEEKYSKEFDKSELNKLMEFNLVLFYKVNTSLNQFHDEPIFSVKFETENVKSFEDLFKMSKQFCIYKHLEFYEKEPEFLEGEVYCDKLNNSKWKIEGDLTKTLTEHKFNNVEYKWFHTIWEGEHKNDYILKLINYDEYHFISIKSENDLRLEDIFEDIGF